MKRRQMLLIILSVFALFALVGTALREPRPGLAQVNTATIDVRLSVADQSFQALKQRPVMVSVIKEGAVVKQSETHLNSSVRFSLPAGIYDLRLEGDGMETLVKRGIHATPGETTSIIGGPMRVGTGLKS